ncbi:CPBP family intramembrane metalloprotease [Sphingomonas psychrotolerans]|uniref:CPBP family intramembrane metalloprotease n=1 Tax=Sphingomonas psychrotolerans TaxID=1327635 RepID=A0ABU3N4P2_9SPHN|nr:CPBP family intramembrane glutamic endopeptidase [Sphingomonas psychrotolerans]MDT8759507.1 CPBP family intramembrane metalloprotease [Sphingomonas psychrotolerans]
MALKFLWLSVMLVSMALWLRRDVAVYRRFEALTATADRQRVYWRWIAQSFTILVGASLVSLWLVGGWSALTNFPAAFEPAHHALKPKAGDHADGGGTGLAIGMAAGLAVVIAVQWRRLRKLLKPARMPGEALIPRNRSEAAIAFLLSLNAGFSEELFFRLALPLLLFDMCGSLPIAFGAAGICFGLAHAYQGWKGIAATMAAGGGLTLIYLSHGSLLRVILLHAAIDIVALLVRPAITSWLARRVNRTGTGKDQLA